MRCARCALAERLPGRNRHARRVEVSSLRESYKEESTAVRGVQCGRDWPSPPSLPPVGVAVLYCVQLAVRLYQVASDSAGGWVRQTPRWWIDTNKPQAASFANPSQVYFTLLYFTYLYYVTKFHTLRADELVSLIESQAASSDRGSLALDTRYGPAP